MLPEKSGARLWSGSYAHVMSDVIERVRQAATDVFAGRPVVVAGGILAGWGPLVEELRAAGAARILLLPGSRGTGPVPEGDDIEVEPLEVAPAPTATGVFRAEERVFADPPA